MFKITSHKGFHITFENGWTVSVQFGGGNYCENYDMPIGSEHQAPVLKSKDAEIAAWDKDGKWFDFGHDEVNGRVDAKYVLKFMNKISKMEGK